MGRLEAIVHRCAAEASEEARGLEAALALRIDQPEHHLRTACTDRPLGSETRETRIEDRTRPRPKSLELDTRDARRPAGLGLVVAVAGMAVEPALLGMDLPELALVAVGAAPSPS